MGITAKQGAQRELTPAGAHVARCIKVIHFGHIPEINFHGQNEHINKVRITWELPNEMRVFDEDKGEQPLSISKDYTVSLGEKANLRKDLEGWRGKQFTHDQLQGFDIANLLGVECMINIIHRTAKTSGNDYSVVSSISPLPKGTTCPPNINPLFIWDYEENYDDGVLENLHDWFKDKIKSSLEYQERMNPKDIQEAPMPGIGDAPEEEADDDLPF